MGNNSTCSTNCNYGITATLYTVVTGFVAKFIVVNTLPKYVVNYKNTIIRIN